MRVTIEERHLEEIIVFRSEVFEDDRGFFSEVYRADQFSELGIYEPFLQENHSGSVQGVIRGLHFQWDRPLSKLMRVTAGTAFLVAVDIRKDSSTLGQWFGLECAARDGYQLWAPAGFARGFCVLSEWAEIQYKGTAIYNPEGESGILWNDPAIGITWPVEDPILSDKDREAQALKEWLTRPESDHFTV